MSKINAYINFRDNNCREAMNFYKECLGGELSLIVVKESPMKDMFPPQLQDIILHADLTKGDLTLLGSDMPNDDITSDSDPVSLTLTCDSKAEASAMFDKLSAGGKIVHPMSTFFAGTMGNIIDKFGSRWGIFTAEQ
jgi:PhnB protein